MRARNAVLVFASTVAVATGGCNVDRLLEGEAPVDVHLAIAVQATQLTVAPGNSASVVVSITRLGDYHGDVAFSLQGVPAGVTGEFGTATTVGQVTTVTVTFRVGTGVTTGSHLITIRGNGTPNGTAAAEVELRILEVPGIGIVPASANVTIIRGGIVPLTVAIARTNFSGPVTLSLSGQPGITAIFASNPITTSSAVATLAVTSNVAPGTYVMTLRSSGAGIPDREAALTVVVSPDALQLVASNAATAQASAVTAPLIVNRYGITGAVTYSAEGLPAGVTVTFGEGVSGATVRFVVAASVEPGPYLVTLRGRAAGGADAVSTLVLTVTPSNVAMSLVPQNVTLLQGTSAASVLTVFRTAFDGPVMVQFADVPRGITVVAADATVIGTWTVLTVAADRQLAPGVYRVTVRASPTPSGEADVPALEPVVAGLFVTVYEAPVFAGNVVLDWSRCTAPRWVAAQDGNGPWTQVTGVQGRYQFALTSSRGAFAFDDGTQLQARYGTGPELSAAAMDFCAAPIPATHSVTGTAQHTGPAEQFTWRLGGGVGTSTLSAPNFTIAGIRDGTHDLVGWGATQAGGTRIYIGRDVNEPAGGSVGSVSLVGTGSFNAQFGSLWVVGLTGESYAVGVSYLTTTACTENPLNQLGTTSPASGTVGLTIFGVPAVFQRPDDYHHVSAVAQSAGSTRAVSLSFNRMTTSTRTLVLPTPVAVSVSAIAGSYRRLRAVVPSIPATYNGALTLRYTDGTRTASVSASVAYFTSSVAVLDMPDLSGVPGFQPTSAVPAGAQGSWTVVLDGSIGESTRCAEGASRWSVTRTGGF